MSQKGFYFDSSRCTGCKTCQLSCKDYKDLDVGMHFRRVLDLEAGEWDKKGEAWTTTCFVYHVSVACNHCENPACLEVCPSGAITKDEETGLVGNDLEICIGCGSCVSACPYEAPSIDEAANVARRCDGCNDRVKEGKAPICVESCPLRALEFGDLDQLKASHSDASAELAPLPGADLTGPSLLIKAPVIEAASVAKASLANESEITIA